jgi:hypothetical protein
VPVDGRMGVSSENLMSERGGYVGCIQRTVVVDWCPHYNPSILPTWRSSFAIIIFNRATEPSLCKTCSVQSTALTLNSFFQ